MATKKGEFRIENVECRIIEIASLRSQWRWISFSLVCKINFAHPTRLRHSGTGETNSNDQNRNVRKKTPQINLGATQKRSSRGHPRPKTGAKYARRGASSWCRSTQNSVVRNIAPYMLKPILQGFALLRSEWQKNGVRCTPCIGSKNRTLHGYKEGGI